MIGKVIVHGGAGFWKKNIRRGLIGVRAAASSGADILARGGSALDGVEAAILALEDDPVFNAGRGSALTIDGTIEMDAAIMDGRDLSAGAVALVHNIKNPIRLARLVMESTDHVLLAGKHAEKLAAIFGLPKVNPITPERLRLWLQWKKDHSTARSGTKWIHKNPDLLEKHPEILTTDTVGAVAMDYDGDFAAASSTGGVFLKLPGRIGDTPQIGCGLYADNMAGAATVTGVGEVAIRLVLSKAVCCMMEQGKSAPEAAVTAVRIASKRLGSDQGVIAVDRRGQIAAVHNTPYMPWAFSTSKMTHPKFGARGKMIARVR